MLVSEEKHACARIVQLVHLVEVRYLRNVHQIETGKVAALLGNYIKMMILKN